MFSASDDIHEIDDGLFMSDIFTAENLTVLERHKITHIVNVCGSIKPKYADRFQYFVIEANDDPS